MTFHSVFLDNLRPVLMTLAGFFAVFFVRKNGAVPPRRILVVPQLTRIGDIVCATPVLRAIKNARPDVYLSVLTTRKAIGVIANNPRIDEIVVLDDEEYLEFFGLWRFFKKIRARKFDAVINIASSHMGTMVGIFGNIPRRIKIAKSHRPLQETLTDWMNTELVWYRDSGRIPILYLSALKPLGIFGGSENDKEVFVSPEGERKAEQFFAAHDLSGLVVGISVTAGNSIKEWGTQKFGELAARIVKEYGARIVFVGSPNDNKKIEEANGVAGGVGTVATEFTLTELPSLIKRFSVFIASDTGPIHLAHALGTPLIDIVGPVDPDEQAPQNEKSIIVRPPPEIVPTIFSLKPQGDSQETRRANDSIMVDAVADAFQTLSRKH